MGEEDTERLESLRPKNKVLEVAFALGDPLFPRGGNGVLPGIFRLFTGTMF